MTPLSLEYWCCSNEDADGPIIYAITCQGRSAGQVAQTTFYASATIVASELWPQTLIVIAAELHARLAFALSGARAA